MAGGTVQYTIVATNAGQSAYPSAVITDALAGALDDGVYVRGSATTGALTNVSGVLNWTGPLPVGAAVAITYTIKVNADDTGDAVLLNRVVSSSIGSTCLGGSGNADCVTSTAVDAQAITLSGMPNSFTLTGLPDSTVSGDGAVTMTVTTNAPVGYQVSVRATSASLNGSAPGNTDSIPIANLRVRESGTSTFLPLSVQNALVVHHQSAASAPGGDAVSTDYQVQIPFVPSDTYTTTLDYIASSQ